MITLSPNADKSLKLILPNTNKALALALKSATAKELTSLTQTKDLGSILDSLLKQSNGVDTAQNRALLELLKSNPTLKSLSNAVPTLKDLLQLLKADKTQTALEKSLQNFLTNIKDIDSKELHSKLKSSGVFLENELKTSKNPKEILSSDLKALLLKTSDELSNAATTPKSQEILKQIDKVLLQIDYHQLVSHLSNASSLYLPYSWDALQEGDINIKKIKNKSYCCDIHLELKEYATVDLRLVLFEKNQLSINISTQSKELKEKILQNLQILKKQLSNAALITKEIRFTEKKENLYSEHTLENLAMGFEVKA